MPPGGSSRGRGKPRGRRSRGSRRVASNEEVMTRNRYPPREQKEPGENAVEEESESESEEEEAATTNATTGPRPNQAETADANQLIEIDNPNRTEAFKEVTLSKKARQQLKAQEYDRIRDQLEREGKTSQSAKDLERLQEIRRKREEEKQQMEDDQVKKIKLNIPTVLDDDYQGYKKYNQTSSSCY
eukprot:Platyproteum_vivax@DN16280_c0_g1_i1.p1